MACIRLLSRLNIYHIPLRSCWHHSGALASNISVQQVFVFFWCQSDLHINCCDACWWILFRWFLRHKKSLGGAKYLWYSASPWLVVLLWIFAPIYSCFVALVVLTSCRQYWPCKNFQRLALFVGHFKNGRAEVRRRSYRWKLCVNVMRRKIED